MVSDGVRSAGGPSLSESDVQNLAFAFATDESAWRRFSELVHGQLEAKRAMLAEIERINAEIVRPSE